MRSNLESLFDSFEIIDFRKFVLFVVFFESNFQFLINFLNGVGGFSSVQFDDIFVEKSSKVLFYDEVEDDLEDESLVRKERNMLKFIECVQEKVKYLFEGKLRKKNCVFRKMRLGEEMYVFDGSCGDSMCFCCWGDNLSDMFVIYEGVVDGRVSE